MQHMMGNNKCMQLLPAESRKKCSVSFVDGLNDGNK